MPGCSGLAIIVIIGNTIRLEIQNRRDEIEVTKLIGAGNAFVRRPFLWSGFWYGLFGSLLALALVWYGLFLLQPTITRLAGLYQSGLTVLSLDVPGQPDHRGVGVALALSAHGSLQPGTCGRSSPNKLRTFVPQLDIILTGLE